jgi:PAS domain S-box-containing protein
MASDIRPKSTMVSAISPSRPSRRVKARPNRSKSIKGSPGTALTASAELYRDIFENAVIAIAIVDLEGKSIAVNGALCELLGYSSDELIGHEFPRVTRQDDVEASEIRDRLLRRRIEGFRQETVYVRKDGRMVRGLTSARLERNAAGKPSHFVSQIIDITALREAEDASSRHANAVEKSNAELEQFAYLASHDLQQPLRAVSSYATLLADRYREQLDARGARWVTHITDGVERMQRLINDLLTLARVRIDSDGFGPTNTAAIVRTVWNILKAQNAPARATLSVQPLPTITGDAAQIELLFQNLVGNAFKYRRPEIALKVAVTVSHRSADTVPMWEFAVRDNGIGLDMKHADHIFEIFRRLHREDKYGGTGIGLAICRKIVTRHGGRIWVDSVPGEGSTFSFTLLESPG